MAQVELTAMSSKTTTTKTETHVQPREVDTVDSTGDAVDLGDDRSVSLTLAWEPPADSGASRKPSATIVVEAAPAAGGPYAECARFSLDSERTPSGSHSFGFTSPGQFLRARWTIHARQQHTPDAVRFSISGRAVGSDAP